MRTAEDRRRIAEADIGKMKHRRGMKIAQGGIEPDPRPDAERAGPEILMRQHHALGKTRRAAGIENPGEIVAATPRIDSGCACRDHVFIVRKPGGRSEEPKSELQ